MTRKKRCGLAISAGTACIAVLCAAGACNGTAKEEKAVHRVIVTTTATTATSQPTMTSTTTAPPTTAPVTTTVETTTEPQITTTKTCATTETTTTTEQTTTVQPITTTASATTTAPTPAEPHNGQTSGDYIYVTGFGWVFNEGGGGEGSVNYEMYCNGNKIGYFG